MNAVPSLDPRPAKRALAPRIVALGIQGRTAFWIAQLVGCSESYAYAVLRAYREEGGEFLAAPARRRYQRIVA